MSAKPVKIVWQSDWTAPERRELAEEGIAQLQQRYRQVTVEAQGWQAGGSTFQALTAQLTAGTLGDIVLGLPDFLRLWAERAVFAQCLRRAQEAEVR